MERSYDASLLANVAGANVRVLVVDVCIVGQQEPHTLDVASETRHVYRRVSAVVGGVNYQ